MLLNYTKIIKKCEASPLTQKKEHDNRNIFYSPFSTFLLLQNALVHAEMIICLNIL